MQKKRNIKSRAKTTKVTQSKAGEKSLTGLDLFSLRELGEFLNLKSPTSQNKDELINSILNFAYGEEEVEEEKVVQTTHPQKVALSDLNKKHREKLAKRLKNTSEIFAFMANPVTSSVDGDGGYCSLFDEGLSHISFCNSNNVQQLQPEESGEISFPDVDDMAKAYGYLNDEDGKWLVRCSRLEGGIEISDTLVNEYNLDRFDNLEFTSIYMPAVDKYVLVDIVTLNGQTGIGGKGVQRFGSLDVVQPSRDKDMEYPEGSSEFIRNVYDIAGIHRGERILVCGGSINNKKSIAQDLFKFYKNESCEVFPICLGGKSGEEVYGSQIRNQITIRSDNSIDDQWEELAISYARAERVAEVGGNSVVLLNSYEALYKMVSEVLANCSRNYRYKVVSQFFEAGSIRSNGGSLTIVFFVDNAELSQLARCKQASTLYIPLKEVGENSYEIDYSLVTNNYFGTQEVAPERKRVRNNTDTTTAEINDADHGKLKFM